MIHLLPRAYPLLDGSRRLKNLLGGQNERYHKPANYRNEMYQIVRMRVQMEYESMSKSMRVQMVLVIQCENNYLSYLITNYDFIIF